jgi:hypothetical protein
MSILFHGHRFTDAIRCSGIGDTPGMRAASQYWQHKQEHGPDYGRSAERSGVVPFLIADTLAQCTDKRKKNRTSD